MSIPMIARKKLKYPRGNTYKTRQLLPGQEFRVKNEAQARVLVHLKQAERLDNPNRKVALDDAREQVGLPPLSRDSDDIKVWRERYEERLGKRPWPGWSIAQLKERIAEG